MLLTQWRSSVGVLKPSPLNTWPKCPPQAAQVISVLLPSGSGWEHKSHLLNYYCKHRWIGWREAWKRIHCWKIIQKGAYRAIYGSRKTLVESWPATPRIELGSGFVKWGPTTSTFIYALSKKFVILTSAWVSGKTSYSINIRNKINFLTWHAK